MLCYLQLLDTYLFFGYILVLFVFGYILAVIFTYHSVSGDVWSDFTKISGRSYEYLKTEKIGTTPFRDVRLYFSSTQ